MRSRAHRSPLIGVRRDQHAREDCPQHWRKHERPQVLRTLVDCTGQLTWSDRLLDVLLDELHVSDEFDGLIVLIDSLELPWQRARYREGHYLMTPTDPVLFDLKTLQHSLWHRLACPDVTEVH
jgi:hypothetical protein